MNANPQKAGGILTKESGEIRPWAFLIAASMTGGGGTLALQQAVQGPLHPFTKTEAHELEKRLSGDIEDTKAELKTFMAAALELKEQETDIERRILEHRLTVVINQLEAQIRRDMPPTATRDRIRAIENHLEDSNGSFAPPTRDWQ